MRRVSEQAGVLLCVVRATHHTSLHWRPANSKKCCSWYNSRSTWVYIVVPLVSIVEASVLQAAGDTWWGRAPSGWSSWSRPPCPHSLSQVTSSWSITRDSRQIYWGRPSAWWRTGTVKPPERASSMVTSREEQWQRPPEGLKENPRLCGEFLLSLCTTNQQHRDRE